MYWEKIKEGVCEVEEISRLGQTELAEFADNCRKKLYELLDYDGIILLEQLICSLELLEKGSSFLDK